MPADSAVATESSQAASDPYVIYQLRKPNQRGTAVIPRFVPNTHAPAFSPANYRFSRVWAANPSGTTSPSTQIQVPRSFEYAGSLGSESSIWSDTSSWVSVSSLKTAPSEVRAPLLHGGTRQVSAASFFNEFDDTRIRPVLRSPSVRSRSARSSELDSPMRDFQYPPALSESISEDAVVDDLMSLPRPEFPHLRNNSNAHNVPRDPKPVVEKPKVRQTSVVRATPVRSTPVRASLLPALTRKRRSFWQWLFCAENVAASTTATSMSHTANAVREKLRQPDRTKPSTVPPKEKKVHNEIKSNPRATQKTKPGGGSADRVPNADKDFFHRSHHAADAHVQSKPRSRRSPSFEILKGRPSRDGQARRSTSWNLLPNLLGRNNKEDDAKDKQKKTSKPKEKSRSFNPDAEGGRRTSRISFQKSSSRKGLRRSRELSNKRDKQKDRAASGNAKYHREEQKNVRQRDDRRPVDRQREDRPRQTGRPTARDPSPHVPVRVSGPPTKLEIQSGTNVTQTSRMQSGESTDPVTSQISSDLSSGMLNRMGTGELKSSTPTPPSARGEAAGTPNYEPVSSGISSDVSSHVSGTHGRHSPLVMQQQQIGVMAYDESSRLDPRANVQYMSSLSKSTGQQSLKFPNTSSITTDNRGYEVREDGKRWEPSYVSDKFSKQNADYTNSHMMDPVARAKEKNMARSAGGPLSYLMQQTENDADVNTGSTGLTSLADESVSTHKTMSAAGDEYPRQYHYQGMTRGNRESATIMSRLSDIADKNVTERKPIFQNSALFSRPGRDSPSHASSGASPRRFHSDWSDPHATAIDVYCQCSCNCVYEEECRRNCDMVYGRSPSVSSSRSCNKKEGYQGFKTLPPAVSNVPVIRRGSMDPDVRRRREANIRNVNRQLDSESNSMTTTTENGGQSFVRASVHNQLPGLPQSKTGVTRVGSNRPGQVGNYTLRSDYTMQGTMNTSGMEDIEQMGVLPESITMLSQIKREPSAKAGMTSSMQIESDWAGDGVGPRGSIPAYTPETTSLTSSNEYRPNIRQRERPKQTGDRPRKRVEDPRPRSRQSGSSGSRPGTADSRRSDGSRRLERPRFDGSSGSTNTSNSTLERRQRRPTTANGNNVVRRSGPPPYHAEIPSGEEGMGERRRRGTPVDEYDTGYDSYSSDKIGQRVRKENGERRQTTSQPVLRGSNNYGSQQHKSGQAQRKSSYGHGNDVRSGEDGRRDGSKPSSRPSSRGSNRSRTPIFGMF